MEDALLLHTQVICNKYYILGPLDSTTYEFGLLILVGL